MRQSGTVHCTGINSSRVVLVEKLDAPMLPNTVHKVCNAKRSNMVHLFDQAQAGFDPFSWPHCIDPARDQPCLFVDSSRETQIYCGRLQNKLTTNPSLKQMVDIAATGLALTSDVRPDKVLGVMTGLGAHVHNGILTRHKISKVVGNEQKKAENCIRAAGKFFNQIWKDFTEYNKLMEVTNASLHTSSAHRAPTTFYLSSNLANSPHVDRDATYTFAVWLTKSSEQRTTWWLLFPQYGIAVRLSHGVICAFDGAKVLHCTAVPGKEDVLHSPLLAMATTVPQNILGICGKKQAFVAYQQHCPNLLSTINVGDRVLLKTFRKEIKNDGSISRRQIRRICSANTLYLEATFISIDTTDPHDVKYYFQAGNHGHELSKVAANARIASLHSNP